MGLVEGEKKGRQEGRQESLRTMTLRILQRRFATSETQLQQIEQQLAKITDEAILNELADAALDVLVLPDFVTRLQSVVPVSA